MKDGSRSALMAVCLIVITVTAAVAASKVYEISFKNTFNTGSVDIGLKQMQIDPSGQYREAAQTVVMPGERVSYMPEVKNLRGDAYIRVRIDIEMDSETETPVTMNNIFDLTDGWVQRGDYFYNTRIMKQGDTAIAFRGLVIPDNWVQDRAASLPAVTGDKTPSQSAGFTVSAHADAIQSEHFRPDFDLDMPWGAVVTETAKAEDKLSYGIADPLVVNNEMDFTGEGGLEANTKNLFRNFQTFMAGEKYSDALRITNSSNSDITVYFRTKTSRTDLVDRMDLDISIEDKKIYDGGLLSEPLNKYIKLVKLKPGEKVTLDYTVTFPDSSRNYYSALADDVEWQFKVIETGQMGNKVKTGDNGKLLSWLVVFVICIALLILFVRKSRNTCTAKNVDQRRNRNEDIYMDKEYYDGSCCCYIVSGSVVSGTAPQAGDSYIEFNGADFPCRIGGVCQRGS